MTSPLVLLILVHPQGLSQQAARHQRDQHRQGNEGLDGRTFPRPGVSASAHLPLAAAKTARQTARPALALAGGAYFPSPSTSGCAGTRLSGGGIHSRGMAGNNRTACGDGLARLPLANPLDHHTAGAPRKGVGVWEAAGPAVSSSFASL